MNLFAFLLILCFASAVPAEDTAAQWAGKNKDTLAAITDASLKATLDQGAPALEKLFAGIKTGGASDPVASTRIAALSQFVMRPAGGETRPAYTNALLAAAQRASEGDVICFFLDQLRWCGLPAQADAIRAFEKSGKPGVSALATITVQAVTDDRASKAAPVKDSPCSALDKELAALSPSALTPRLLQLAEHPDLALAGVALAWARTAGGPQETTRWTAKLTSIQDPVRKTMLLDMLEDRGDKGASPAVAACLTDADDTVAAAAQRALLALDPAAFAVEVPSLLKNLLPERQSLVREGMRRLQTSMLKSPLLSGYESFSDAGKKIALEALKERRASEATDYGLAALDSPDGETALAGWHLVRETAGKEHAATLLTKLLATKGRVLPEAQTSYAVAARRDTTGAYARTLLEALQTASSTEKPLVLEAASRLGGESLLKAVDAASASPDDETSTAAVRALADWPDVASVPALLRLAATGATPRQQILAQRGLTKKLSPDGVDKKAAFVLWQGLKPKLADEARRKAIDDLFKQLSNPAAR